MRAEDLEPVRKHMLAVIAASAFELRDTIGKSAFDERVMTSMGKVPRHEFVPIEFQPYAYANIPLPIGFAKTISQPFVVALMTDLLDIKADDSVLEIGTGLGYQAAILAQLARRVYSVEIIEELGQAAKQRLRQQGCSNVELKIANGYHGWSEHAPFDKVIVTAAPDLIPPPLIHQLKAGGKMVIPAGLPNTQQLILAETQASHLDAYLVACLLAFFQQQRLYKEQSFAFRPFNIDTPLWNFVGGSVTKTLASR